MSRCYRFFIPKRAVESFPIQRNHSYRHNPLQNKNHIVPLHSKKVMRTSVLTSQSHKSNEDFSPQPTEAAYSAKNLKHIITMTPTNIYHRRKGTSSPLGQQRDIQRR